MNNEWVNFLTSQGASIEQNTVKDFGLSYEQEQAAYSNLVIADLSHYALIEASGDDVVEFLQGQLTNDIKNVTEQQGQLSAYCNPKGRILASFRVFQRHGLYYLELHAGICENTLKRLRMFVMRSKVELVDRSNELVRIGIAGQKASEKLATIFNSCPVNNDDSITENEITLIKLAGATPRYEAHGPLDKIQALWQSLQDDAVAIGDNSWNLLTIRAGIPEIVADTVEEFVPQMVNLQAINSLSFTKGCYPGQEVVARMHYLGKLKRRLFIASIDSDNLPKPGQAVFTSEENAAKAGQIVTASWSSDNKIEVLAVLLIDKAENDNLHINSHNGPVLNYTDLPYSLERQDKS